MMNSPAAIIFRDSRFPIVGILIFLSVVMGSCLSVGNRMSNEEPRQRVQINDGWSFYKYESPDEADSLIYDVRPPLDGVTENRVADARPTEALEMKSGQMVLKPWILPSANQFIRDTTKHRVRPEGNPGINFPFVLGDFDDGQWEKVNLPHDWAIEGPFQAGSDPEVGGGMGRLPVNGVGWYRRKLDMPKSDQGKRIYLDVDGAMSYTMVWLNGSLVGGWPYGYNSWRLDLTPYINFGETNQLAIRVDNPNHSARWYPGGGLYRDVWITKTQPVHVGQWGTYINARDVSDQSAIIDLSVTVNNPLGHNAEVTLMTTIYSLDSLGNAQLQPTGTFPEMKALIQAGQKTTVSGSVEVENPRLWGPPPTQKPHLYMAETVVVLNGEVTDRYTTRFGIRSVEFNPTEGFIINGERVYLKGVNQHHDLGALGAAFNMRAAERQLEILREMGCNAIRMAHNPPAPGLLELTDRMGFLVINEIFDSWERKKTPHDFHLIFPDWWEADTRAFVQRDRNAPSVIMWSFGNEVGEQYTGEEGAEVARMVHQVVREE
ncbi:MAG TPA: beta-galactosidase, partial [Prolixibacteraceae bacterium]|nr:beta-galactosidase [Prolixibacteraceae bacterium]